MTEIRELGYVSVGVSDLEAFRHFSTDIVGAMVGEESEDGFLLRNDMCIYRIRVDQDDSNDLKAIGWCVSNVGALESLATKLEENNVAYERGTAEECEQRKVHGFIAFDDPEGIRQEAFYGLGIAPGTPFYPSLPNGGFVTGDEGMGHVGVWVDDLEVCIAFYRDLLGMILADRIHSDRMKGAFMRCNLRQHSIALVQRPAPGATPLLHHIQFEYNEIDDVGRAYDRAKSAGVLMSTLGKHQAEPDLLSFYMYTPAGFGFELSWWTGGEKQLWEDERPETWHDDNAHWGHIFFPPSS